MSATNANRDAARARQLDKAGTELGRANKSREREKERDFYYNNPQLVRTHTQPKARSAIPGFFFPLFFSIDAIHPFRLRGMHFIAKARAFAASEYPEK